MIDLALPSFTTLLTEDVGTQTSCFGAQYWIAHRGHVVASGALGVDGADLPVEESSLFSVHCAGKPLTALAIAALVDGGELSLDDQLRHVLTRPISARLGDATIAQVLRHRAGLHRHMISWMSLHSADERDAVIFDGEARKVPRTRSVYAEFGGWHVLGRVIEELTGQSVDEFVRSRVLAPLELEDEIFLGLTPEQFDRHHTRLRVNVKRLDETWVPLLAERHLRTVTDIRPAMSTLATMRGLGRLYEALRTILDEREHRDEDLESGGGRVAPVVAPATLATLLRPDGPAKWEPVMARTCRYGLGFMIDLADHRFGPGFSAGSFGHSGLAGVTAALADPGNELVAAVHCNGQVGTDVAIDQRRVALFTALFDDLGLPAQSSDPAVPVPSRA